jgi:hypothetical protein
MIERTKLSPVSSSPHSPLRVARPPLRLSLKGLPQLGLLLLCLLLLGQACEQKVSVREIGPSRPEAIPEDSPTGEVSHAARFGYRVRPDRPKQPQADPKPVYDLPEGWKVLPVSQYKTVNLQVAGDEQATCHMSILGGTGGGLLANVNRWRSQIGLAPIGQEELAKLPRHKFFNNPALLLDLKGRYAGMSGGSGKEEWGLMGLLLVSPKGSLFLKMQGPSELLQKEKQNFLDLASSFRLEAPDHADHPGHEEHAKEAGKEAGGAAASPPSKSGSKGGLRYDQPVSWQPLPGSQYRLVNFAIGKGGQTECYVSQSGGGLLPNINRWRGQMGLKPVNDGELSKLPKLMVLGVETPLLRIEGSFQGMSGPRIDKAGMLATYVETRGTSFAIKLTGPIAEVVSAKKDFVNFVQSMRMR